MSKFLETDKICTWCTKVLFCSFCIYGIALHLWFADGNSLSLSLFLSPLCQNVLLDFHRLQNSRKLSSSGPFLEPVFLISKINITVVNYQGCCQIMTAWLAIHTSVMNKTLHCMSCSFLAASTCFVTSGTTFRHWPTRIRVYIPSSVTPQVE